MTLKTSHLLTPLITLLLSIAIPASVLDAQTTDPPKTPITSGPAKLLPADEHQIDFGRDIAPILQQHCIRCHYPGFAEGEVSLATLADVRDLDYVDLDHPTESYILELVRPGLDGSPPAMPKDGPPLSPDQIEMLQAWIQQGAVWPEDIEISVPSQANAEWWSFQPLEQASPPSLDVFDEVDASWRENPIDAWVLDRLSAEQLRPNPPAEKLDLIRRASYDLTGLPPTPAEIDRFLADQRSDAYSRMIDRLLQSPRYGERWGRHWLDVVRFGESTGYERNIIIDDAWPFRDYVIASLNQDKPCNQFIMEHLAGDVISDDPNTTIGSAFLVNGPYDMVGNQDPIQAAQIRANTIDEIVRATSEAFLGLTVGCARCHDHKFDPILQRDYYQLYATFAGIKHGSAQWTSSTTAQNYRDSVRPHQQRKQELEAQQKASEDAIRERALASEATYQQTWKREPVDRTGTVEEFEPVTAKYIRLTCLARDDRPTAAAGFSIDEFEIWSAEDTPRNVALESQQAKAEGPSRKIEDFPGAYAARLAIDGQFGARYLATSNYLLVQLPVETPINKVQFSSARHELRPEQGKFSFVADYRIEVSLDKEVWTEVANGDDRRPVNEAHKVARLIRLETTPDDLKTRREVRAEIAKCNSAIAAIPKPRTAWIGTRDTKAAEGPFHVFLGGDPQKPGKNVTAASMDVLQRLEDAYQLPDSSTESERRLALAKWITSPSNPLTARVLANRVWQKHFGIGIVATPNDFGFMGQAPSHPELLDYLAQFLIDHNWQLKPLHRAIMLSQTYQQSSAARQVGMQVDANSRLLWRYPPRRLSAEEVRDSMLSVAGVLREEAGGPGFRLYEYLQDNVATYVPLESHGPDSYRRGIYHQNARACVTDLLTEFDQPDCAFSAPRRVSTTTPLQALTALNHAFTLDMANAMAKRLDQRFPGDNEQQIRDAYRLSYGRIPDEMELQEALAFIDAQGLSQFCRVLLNTSEFIYIP